MGGTQEADTVEGPQVSGKVFRFLSAMHPALSKSERKRYAGYDPDKWYPWTPELSSEFTELMRRSPRDTSFARGFAYVAQRAIPEGQYVPTGALLGNLDRLPSAYRGPDGSGFLVTSERPGQALVRYSGLPGFANVCIAIQGELVQRMQASGAHSVVVKHRPSCRLNGADVCEFEVEWSGESPPAEARPVRTQEIVMDYERYRMEMPPAGPGRETAEPLAASSKSPYGSAGMETARAGSVATNYGNSNGGHSQLDVPSSHAAGGGGELASSDDLFIQLRKRLAEADRQARLYADAQQEIDRLRIELGRVRAQAEAEVAQAQKEKAEALDALAEFKRRIRTVVGTD
jgi:hypothetical protein